VISLGGSKRFDRIVQTRIVPRGAMQRPEFRESFLHAQSASGQDCADLSAIHPSTDVEFILAENVQMFI